MNYFLQISDYGELVWAATWQAAMLAVVVFAITATMSRFISAPWRTVLWTLPVLRFLMLVVPATSLSIVNLLPSSAPDTPIEIQATESTFAENSLPLVGASDFENPTLASNSHQIDAAAESVAAPSSATAGEVGKATSWWSTISIRQFLFMIWLAGVVLMLAKWMRARLALKKLLARSTPLDNRSLLSIVKRIQKELSIHRTVTCVVCTELLGPATCGLFRPVILLPAGSHDDQTRDDFEMMVIHEMSHIRRFDAALIALSRLAVAIHWFNPMAYFVSRRIHREIEFATDAMTMKQLGESSLEPYVSLLLRLGQRQQGSKPGLTEMANSKSILKPRVNHLIEHQDNRRWHFAFSLALVCLLAFVGLTKAQTATEPVEPIAKNEAAAEPQDESAPQEDSAPQKEVEDDADEFEAWLAEEGIILNGDLNKAQKKMMMQMLRKRYAKQFPVESQEIKIQRDHLEQTKKWMLSFPENIKVNEFAGVIVDEEGNPLAGATVDLFPAFTGHETKTDQQGMFRFPLGFPSKGNTTEVRFSKDGYSPFYCRKQKLDSPNLCVILNRKTYLEGRVVDANNEPVPNAAVVAAHPYHWNADYPNFNRETATKSDKNGNYRLYLHPETYTVAAITESSGVERVQGIEVKLNEAQTLDIQLNDGVKFRAKVLDLETKEPVAGLTLYHRTNSASRGVSDADGLIEIPNSLPGDEELQIGFGTPKLTHGYFKCPTEPFGKWRSPDAKKPWHRDLTTEVGILFDLEPEMEPVTIYVQTGVFISGKVIDPDGNPVAGATVAAARTGTGNSLTGDTRFSVETEEDGTYSLHLPASGGAEHNLLAHDGKYQQWRKFASGVTESFQTTAGQKLENVDIQLHRPATVRGRVTAGDGRSVQGLEVRAHAADKRGNRYYDPTTTTNDDGSFELSFIRPGKHLLQVEPFWLTAEDAPAESWLEIDIEEGETQEGFLLEAVENK